ncbi:MAG: hypothetical protein QW721_01090 [Desulfurococcaceae archaeon]
MLVDVKLKHVLYGSNRVSDQVAERAIRAIMISKLYNGKRFLYCGGSTSVVTYFRYFDRVLLHAAPTTGEAVKERTFREPGFECKYAPLLMLPRELRVQYSIGGELVFDAIIEVKLCKLLELVDKLWKSTNPSLRESDRLVAVYVKLRNRGVPLPVRLIGELVGAWYTSVHEAEELIKTFKLFTTKPNPELVKKALVELGVPVEVAEKVNACLSASQGEWTIYHLSGCLRALGVTAERVEELIGVTEVTSRRHMRAFKGVL